MLAVGASGASAFAGAVHLLAVDAAQGVVSSRVLSAGTPGLAIAAGDYFGVSLVALGDTDGAPRDGMLRQRGREVERWRGGALGSS